MRSRLLPLLALCSLFASVLLPPPEARTQERGGAAAAGAAGYHALVIGNNNYASLPRLKTAESDAREVASLLKDAYGFETRLLLNATRQQIVTALFAYRQTLGPEANLLVYYAGHGINDTQAEKSYWLPVDATRGDDSNWISADDITTRIRAIPARHVLVISDSCYSGTLTRGLGEALPPPNAREQFLLRMMAGRSRTLMASGGDEPVADNGSGGHSVFANALLRGLRDMDKGKFTAAELFRNYVQEPVAGRAQQTPEYNPLRNSGHESGDFVFVKIKTDGKNVEVAVTAPPPTKVDPARQELAFWEAIKGSGDPEDFKDYLSRYPNGLYAGIARRRVSALGNAAPTGPGGPPQAANNTKSRPPAEPAPGADKNAGQPPPSGRANEVEQRAEWLSGQLEELAAVSDSARNAAAAEAGDYLAAGSGVRITVAAQGASLTMTVPGQPTYALEQVGERRYRPAGLPGFFVTFRAAKDDPRETEMYVEQPQGNLVLRRVSRAGAPARGGEAAGTSAIPDGTTLTAVLNNDLSARNTREGDRFTLTVRSPSQYDGAVIEGTVSHVQRSGRVSGRSELTLSFETVRLRDGRTYRFEGVVESVRSAGGGSVSVDNGGAAPGGEAAKGGIGNSVGSIIGAIAGGGKGAAIGAAIGGGAGGGGSVIVQAGGDLELRSGAEITIRATEPKKQ